MIRLALLTAASLLAATLALAQLPPGAGQMVPGQRLPGVPFGSEVPNEGTLTPNIASGAAPPPPTCTADGKTDWSNACDIPMGVALGVL